MARSIPKVGTRGKYPWPRWTNGKAWRAVQGSDFSIAPWSFVSSLHKRASRKGMTVKVHVDGPAVEFQFRKRK